MAFGVSFMSTLPICVQKSWTLSASQRIKFLKSSLSSTILRDHVLPYLPCLKYLPHLLNLSLHNGRSLHYAVWAGQKALLIGPASDFKSRLSILRLSFSILFHVYRQPKCSDQPMRTVVLCPRQSRATSRLVARLHCNHTASKWKDGREGHIRLTLECMLHWTDHPFWMLHQLSTFFSSSSTCCPTAMLFSLSFFLFSSCM